MASPIRSRFSSRQSKNNSGLDYAPLESRQALASLNTQYNVELQTHEVLFSSFDHLSLLITPQNPGLFNDSDGDNRADQDPLFLRRSDGSFALSIGAGPDEVIGGKLISAFNRPYDHTVHPSEERVSLSVPAGMKDSRAWVNELISRSAAYDDQLPYAKFPGITPGVVYNSNSFIAGLLSVTGTVLPDLAAVFPDGDYPGLTTPVPAANFGAGPSARLDLIFVVDTTSSMSDDISSAKASASRIIREVYDNFRLDGETDARVAIMDYRDFPQYPYGASGDYPFHDVQAFVSKPERAEAGVNSLTLGNGGDIPESVYSGLMHAIDSTSLGSWRGDGVRRAVILIGDAPGHDPEPFTGYKLSTVSQAAKDGGVGFYSRAAAFSESASSSGSVDIYTVSVGSSSSAIRNFEDLARGNRGQSFNAPDASSVVDVLVEAIKSIENNPPTLNPLGNGIMSSGGGARSVMLSGISAGTGESQPLRVTATSSRPDLIYTPYVYHESPNSTGWLVLTPVIGSTGTADISVTVEDGGNDGDLQTAADNKTITQTFGVKVELPPMINGVSGWKYYKKNSAPVQLTPFATLANVDSGILANSTLRVSIKGGAGLGNRLWIGPGFGIDLNNGIWWQGQKIGERNPGGGKDYTDLQINFNSAATSLAVQTLIRSIQFQTFKAKGKIPRAIEFELTDNLGGKSNLATVNISFKKIKG